MQSETAPHLWLPSLYLISKLSQKTGSWMNLWIAVVPCKSLRDNLQPKTVNLDTTSRSKVQVVPQLSCKKKPCTSMLNSRKDKKVLPNHITNLSLQMSLVGKIIWDMLSAILDSNFLTKVWRSQCWQYWWLSGRSSNAHTLVSLSFLMLLNPWQLTAARQQKSIIVLDQ